MQLNLPKTISAISLLCFVQKNDAEGKETEMAKTDKDEREWQKGDISEKEGESW